MATPPHEVSGGPDQTVDRSARGALIDAAKDLLVDHGPGDISGRRLAVAAGVNYGLVHRHFGRKDEVLTEAMDDMSRTFAEQAGRRHEGQPGTWSEETQRFVIANTRWTLDGSIGERNPLGAANPLSLYAAAVAAPEGSEQPARQAALVALSFALQHALHVYRAAVLPAAGVGPNDNRVDHNAWNLIRLLEHGSAELGSPGPRVSAPSSAPPASEPWTGQVETSAELTGRSAVEHKLVMAGAALLMQRPASSISARELAREAGVNYGLIHHYFGTKNAVLRRSVQTLRADFLRTAPAGKQVPPMFAVRDHPGYVRVFTQAALEPSFYGPDYHFIIVERLLDTLLSPAMSETEESATRCAVYIVVTAQLAWQLLNATIADAFNHDLDELQRHAGAALRSVLRDPQRLAQGHEGN